MDERLKSLEKQAGQGRDLENPPLHLWHPPLSGDIPIIIAVDGTWFHDGGEIRRQSLVSLFASILRREEDGEYYLVTPAEKWRIEVAQHALIVTDFEITTSRPQLLTITLNTGRRVNVDASHPLYLDETMDGVAVVGLDHGLSAVFSRAAWYRLVNAAEETGGVPTIHSSGAAYPLVQ